LRDGSTHQYCAQAGQGTRFGVVTSQMCNFLDQTGPHWAAAHVDEDWNTAFWGRDELAPERRAYRFAESEAAAKVLILLKL
jgi:chaperone required for assembly of F1-ATPase